MSSPSGSVGSTSSNNPISSLQALGWDPSTKGHDLDTDRVTRVGDRDIEERVEKQAYDFFNQNKDQIGSFSGQLRGLLTQHIVRAHHIHYQEAHEAYGDKGRFLIGDKVEVELVIQELSIQVFAKQFYEVWEVQNGNKEVVGYDFQLVQVIIDPNQMQRDTLLLTDTATKVLSFFNGFVKNRDEIQW